MSYLPFETLVGKTLISVIGKKYDEKIIFTASTGEIYKLWHMQDCCESVWVEDIIGELDDLIGSPIVAAAEVSSQGQKPANASITWTFYNIATAKGYVSIRWCGESNGYYSESVDFAQVY